MPVISEMTASSQRAAIDFPDLDSLEIAPALASKKGAGARICPLEGIQLKMIIGSMEEPIRVPFEISNWDKSDTSTRVNLNYELTDTTHQAKIELLDEK